MVIKDGNDGVQTKTHSHLPDGRLLKKSKVINGLKVKAKTTSKLPGDLVAEACASMKNDIKTVMPTERNLRRLVTNIQKEMVDVRNPKTLAELSFPPASVTVNGQNFLLYDSAVSDANSDRTVIFGTTENLNILARCATIAMDGTFKVTPPPFHQLYTIHGIATVLTRSFNNIFRSLQRHLGSIRLHSVHEQATKNLRQSVENFEEYFFHFCQNVWRHVEDVGLQSQYADDELFSINIRMLMALALVPVNDVVKSFETLVESSFWEDDPTCEFNKEKQALLNYFESKYIGLPGRTSNSNRRATLFSIKLWNAFFLLERKHLLRSNLFGGATVESNVLLHYY